MRLRNLANARTQLVNANRVITWIANTGYTVDATYRQVPTWAEPVSVVAQVQTLTSDELEHLDGLNISGRLLSVYLYQSVDSVLRPEAAGGDILQIDGNDWLVVLVAEAWPDWRRVVVRVQDANA